MLICTLIVWLSITEDYRLLNLTTMKVFVMHTLNLRILQWTTPL